MLRNRAWTARERFERGFACNDGSKEADVRAAMNVLRAPIRHHGARSVILRGTGDGSFDGFGNARTERVYGLGCRR